MCCGLFRCPKLDKNEQCVPLLDKKHNVNMRLQAIANQFGVAGRGLRVFRGETELGRCVHKYCNRLPTHCTTFTVHPSNRHPRNPTTTCFHSTIHLQRSKSTRLLSLWNCGTAHFTRAPLCERTPQMRRCPFSSLFSSAAQRYNHSEHWARPFIAVDPMRVTAFRAHPRSSRPAAVTSPNKGTR